MAVLVIREVEDCLLESLGGGSKHLTGPGTSSHRPLGAPLAHDGRPLTEEQLRLVRVVRLASQLDVLHLGSSAGRVWLHVMKLEKAGLGTTTV